MLSRVNYDAPGCRRFFRIRKAAPRLQAQSRAVTERLLDVRYVCAGCGMEMKRAIAGEAHCGAGHQRSLPELRAQACSMRVKSNNNDEAITK
jgi:hypothetical protein